VTAAEELTRALGGSWRRGARAYGRAKCPVHADREPSLSIRSGGPDGIKVKCFAGCDPEAIVDELKKLKLWNPAPGEATQYERPKAFKHEPNPRALAFWSESRVDDGSVVGAYLRNRAITLAVPNVLRRTPNDNMIAALSCPRGKVIACQITWLQDGKKAALATPRLTYGEMGLSSVRLDAFTADVAGIAEGIESAMSATEIFGTPCWATLGAARLSTVWLPDHIRTVYIFGDNGAPGHAAARKAAAARSGLKNVIHFPPPEFKDFNDLLQSRRRT
jgi:putative DNA primase/helicase